ncbi:MAG: hypothetical protein K2N15_10935 [Lachnospiraceae bacterium]|nr:hypothetical protein [Lachnospiraceae bacterium]
MQDIIQLKIYYGLTDKRRSGENMAVWQFQCNIIPLRENIDKLSRDEMISWKDISQPITSPDFLEREKSWSTDIVQFGNIDETCIEFIYDKDKLEEINCRLDLRTLTKHDLIQIIDYVKSIGACFLVDDKIYPSKLESMIPIMKQSKANQYCKSPLEYFKSFNQIE